MSSSNPPPRPINPYGAPQAAVSVQYGLQSRGFKDRKGGLIAFGIVEIILGVGCFAMTALMAIGLAVGSATSEEAPDWRTLVPALLLYGFLAVLWVSLGIGSIRARRWARSVVLILAWFWLVSGSIMTVTFLFLLPAVLGTTAPDGNPLPPEAKIVAVVVSAVFMAVFFIVLPGILVLFYRSRHVKATCEAYDPTPSWTDACPLPVLALSLFLVFGSLTMLAPPAVANGVMMFFGTILSGWTGSMVYWILAALWLYAAWAVYRVQLAGWWITFVSYLLFLLFFYIHRVTHRSLRNVRKNGIHRSTIGSDAPARRFDGTQFCIVVLGFLLGAVRLSDLREEVLQVTKLTSRPGT